MGMIFLSDEDVDSKAIISSWLARNNADDNLKRLMEEMFIKGKQNRIFYLIFALAQCHKCSKCLLLVFEMIDNIDFQQLPGV